MDKFDKMKADLALKRAQEKDRKEKVADDWEKLPDYRLDAVKQFDEGFFADKDEVEEDEDEEPTNAVALVGEIVGEVVEDDAPFLGEGVLADVPGDMVGELAAQIVLDRSGYESTRYFVGKKGFLGVQLMGDPRISSEVVRLAGTRLIGLGMHVADVYHNILTKDFGDDSRGLGVQATTARDLATRLGYQVKKNEVGDLTDRFKKRRAYTNKKRKQIEENVNKK